MKKILLVLIFLSFAATIADNETQKTEQEIKQEELNQKISDIQNLILENNKTVSALNPTWGYLLGCFCLLNGLIFTTHSIMTYHHYKYDTLKTAWASVVMGMGLFNIFQGYNIIKSFLKIKDSQLDETIALKRKINNILYEKIFTIFEEQQILPKLGTPNS